MCARVHYSDTTYHDCDNELKNKKTAINFLEISHSAVIRTYISKLFKL